MPTLHPDLIVSVSGIRGIVGESLTADIARAFGHAFGTYLNGGTVVVGRDSRSSGPMLADAVAAGLMAAGCEIHSLDIAPTPTVGFAVRELQAEGGVQVTASHNAAPYNGLKLFGPLGMVLTPEEGEKILRIFLSPNIPSAEGQRPSGVSRGSNDIARKHLLRVLDQVDVARIKEHAYRVLLDANHGAGGPMGLLLLSALGCQAVPVGCDPDGDFAHEPEPTETNLKDIARRVREEHCAIGLALDPDSDRLALIDETGRYIGEELTLAMAMAFRLQHLQTNRLGEPGALATGGYCAGTPVAYAPGSPGNATGVPIVVINMSTSRVNEDIARRHGVNLLRVPVGEAHVARTMMETGAVIGGEGNGGVIDPRVGWVRDPFIGAALVLNYMAETGKKLSELADALPRYVIVKEKYPLARERLPVLYENLLRAWPEAQANRDDGLRLDWPDRWLHVRPSNTEPIVRVIAEAPEEEGARELCETCRSAIDR